MVSLENLLEIIHKNKLMLFRFLLVGALTAVFYLGLFIFLWKTFGINYHIAVTIAYIISTLTYFIINRNFTFKSQGNAIAQQFSKFLVVVFLNYVITLVIVHGAVEVLMLQPYFGTVLAIATTTLFNYVISKSWVFKHG